MYSLASRPYKADFNDQFLNSPDPETLPAIIHGTDIRSNYC